MVGKENVFCMDDKGDTIFTHKHQDILRFQAGLDEMSFAYIYEDKFDSKGYCHAFQCCSKEDVSWKLL